MKLSDNKKYCLLILPWFLFSSTRARECTTVEKKDMFLSSTPLGPKDLGCTIPFSSSPIRAMYGCLTNKTCIAVSTSRFKKSEVDLQPNCIESLNCNQLVGYHVEPELSSTRIRITTKNKAIDLDMYTTKKLSIAVGISQHKNPASEFIVKCQQSEGDAPETIYSWLTNSNKKTNYAVDIVNQKNMVNRKIEPFWGADAIYCKVSLKMNFNVEDPETKTIHKFDFSRKKYCLSIYTYLPAREHIAESTYTKVHSCSSLVNLNLRHEPIPSQKIFAVYHGIFMSLAWVLLMPTVNFIGRHFRKACSGTRTCCKVRSWLIVHALLAFTTVLPVAAGKYVNVLYKMHWNHSVIDLTLHGVLGYVSMALLGINLLFGFCVKSKSAKTGKPNTLAYLHSFTCETATILCGIVITMSPGIPFTSITCNIREVGIAWLVFYLAANMMMSYQEFWIPALMGKKEDLAKLPSKSELLSVLTGDKHKNIRKSISREPQEYNKARYVALLLFIIIALIFTSTICLLLYFPPTESCYIGESTEFFEKVALES